MKKFCFSVILILFFLGAESQTHYQLDSLVISGLSKTVYSYDEQNRLQQSLNYNVNFSTSEMEPGTRTTYTYNISGQLEEEIEENWDADSAVWKYNQKTTHFWNNGQEMARIEFDHDGEWQRTDSMCFVYNASDHMVSDTSYFYDGINWIYSNYTEYIRFPSGHPQFDSIFHYYPGSGLWAKQRVVHYFYSDELLTSQLDLSWDSDLMEWNRTDSVSFQYDEYDYLTQTVTHDYVDSLTSWENFMKTQVYYDYSVSPSQMNYPQNGDMGMFLNSPKVDSAGIFSWEDDAWGTSPLPVYFYYSTYQSIENLENVDIQLYPNPVAGNLILDTEYAFSSYVIFNSAGTCVQSGKLVDGRNQIDCSRLPKGNYIIRLSDKMNKMLSRPVIKM
ncbi:MAG: T9SS type A sorting domain-containing protein [Bacteroidales bacterium]